MPGRDGPENLGILKKSQLKLDRWGESWIFYHWGRVERCSWVFRISTDRYLKHHKMRSMWGWSQHSIVSIDFSELCLSPRVIMEWSQKLIKPFVSETTESACICICIVNCCDWYHYHYGCTNESVSLFLSFQHALECHNFFVETLILPLLILSAASVQYHYIYQSMYFLNLWQKVTQGQFLSKAGWI